LASLHRTAYALCGDSHRADDIVQATIAALYFSWKKVSRVENIDGYVRRILVRRYMDERRRRWSRVQLHVTVPDVDVDGAADQRIAERDELLTALRELPKGQRAVLVLRFLNDLSVAETAEAMGCSEGNVKSQSSRGLAALRSVLGNDRQEAGDRW
jgi:RNA polymerase sigma-70 factor (sigma-E family)